MKQAYEGLNGRQEKADHHPAFSSPQIDCSGPPIRSLFTRPVFESHERTDSSKIIEGKSLYTKVVHLNGNRNSEYVVTTVGSNPN